MACTMGEHSRALYEDHYWCMYRHLILYLLRLEPLLPNDDNTRRSRTGLGHGYVNCLVEGCFWKKENLNQNMEIK